MRKHARCRILSGIMLTSALLVAPVGHVRANSENGQRPMTTGERTSQPIGHYDFCQRSVADCRRITFNTAPRKLTQERWIEIVRVNEKLNATIRPITDIEFFGVEEYWTLPETAAGELVGDCEDYVLAKQKALMELGWPAATLLPTVVRRTNGEGHAVLTVRTDRGDFILDNLTNRVRSWNEVPYTYLKRVSAAHSGRWETIIDQRLVVGSIQE